MDYCDFQIYLYGFPEKENIDATKKRLVILDFAFMHFQGSNPEYNILNHFI